MLTGGGGTSVNATRATYLTDELLSTNISPPTSSPRPFDKQRDGMVRGEGASVFVLETREHAAARGAEPLCVVGGWGSSVGQVSDTRYTGATQDAIERSIKTALKNSNCKGIDISHVNAEGIATVEADRREAKAIRNCLGNVPVTALKSYFGHLAAGAGAMEMAGSVLSLKRGRVPATLNYSTPDPDCPINVIHGDCLESPQQAAMLLNQSSTGQSVAVVLQSA